MLGSGVVGQGELHPTNLARARSIIKRINHISTKTRQLSDLVSNTKISGAFKTCEGLFANGFHIFATGTDQIRHTFEGGNTIVEFFFVFLTYMWDTESNITFFGGVDESQTQTTGCQPEKMEQIIDLILSSIDITSYTLDKVSVKPFRSSRVFPEKQCYNNSFLCLLDNLSAKQMMFVYGFVCRNGFPIQHAWVQLDDEYYDPTLSENSLYYKVLSVPFEEIRQHVMRLKYVPDLWEFNNSMKKT